MTRADIASPSLLISAGVPHVAKLILSPVANLLDRLEPIWLTNYFDPYIHRPYGTSALDVFGDNRIGDCLGCGIHHLV